jgi:hypothetical protein
MGKFFKETDPIASVQVKDQAFKNLLADFTQEDLARQCVDHLFALDDALEVIDELGEMNDELMAHLTAARKQMSAAHKEFASIPPLLEKTERDRLKAIKAARILADLVERQHASLQKSIALTSSQARNAANALHDKPGGSRDKAAAIKAAWVSGRYSSRDICAEQECAALGLSFSTARKALRGTADPA